MPDKFRNTVLLYKQFPLAGLLKPVADYLPWLLVSGLLFYSAPSAAAADGAQLLAACEQALETDFRDMQGAMCHWYVLPCDCEYSSEAVLPRVCLPPAARIENLAQEVITGLRARPELQAEPAALAAATILAAFYPCPDDH